MHHRTLFFWLVFVCFGLVCSGCASKISQAMPRISTLTEAHAAFGPAHAVKELPDGTAVHEWFRDGTDFVPGQYVTQRIYMGHDRDGYRKYYEREVWVPAHRTGNYCRIVIQVNKTGLVLHSAYQGNACDAMLRQDAVR